MSVKTFTEKHTTSAYDGRRIVHMQGGFDFAEHEVDEGELLYSLSRLRQTLIDLIDEAVKELHKIK